jgi:GT2 family glycosyltransferase
MHFDIQLVLYNSESKLQRLIEFLEKSGDFGIRLYLRANDSKEMEYLQILENHPAIASKNSSSKEKQISYKFFSGGNIGFGAGHNQIFKRYSSEYDENFLVLNPDTQFLPFSLKRLAKLLWDKVPSSKQMLPNWGQLELRQFPIEHPKPYNPSTLETNWVSGAGFVTKKEAYEKLGGFDEALFMYCEDIDYSIRLRGLGYRCYYLPEVALAHAVGASSKENFNKFSEILILAGQVYLREKYKLNSLEDRKYINWALNSSKFSKEVKEEYKKILARADKNDDNNSMPDKKSWRMHFGNLNKAEISKTLNTTRW